MNFTDILGHSHLKSHLMTSADNGRIPHAQLFIGKEGCGTLPMALAYAKYILCLNHPNPELCGKKCDNLAHPDLYFAFPTAITQTVKKDPVSNLFLEEWREFVAKNPYGSVFQWFQQLGIENKQGNIGVNEAKEISKSLSLKSFESNYKVVIIWMAESMNVQASNKLLKLIEEPPEKTVFLLIAEKEEQILTTITSRCQILHFPLLSEADITEGLVKQLNLSEEIAKNIAHQSEGNFNKALSIAQTGSADEDFEKWLVGWLRAAFRAKGNASVIQELISISEVIASSGRETQKKYLQYCLHFFRQALLLNYNAKELVYLQTTTPNFQLEKLAPFIHSKNILTITEEFNQAIYHIERNGNAKIILLDLSIKLTKLIHTKE
ncbi:MAG: DNA polymerase III subunit delta' [Flavobacteriaceae bacterium]|nr:DNA polymerase III subunit delta' [Flavobacteriaceae bacterium]